MNRFPPPPHWHRPPPTSAPSPHASLDPLALTLGQMLVHQERGITQSAQQTDLLEGIHELLSDMPMRIVAEAEERLQQKMSLLEWARVLWPWVTGVIAVASVATGKFDLLNALVR